MTPRGRPRNRSTEDQSNQSILLSSRVSSTQHCADDLFKEINPNSDENLLRRHRSIDRDNSNSVDHVAKSGLFERFLMSMSQSSLLRKPASLKDGASYGALYDRVSRSHSEDRRLTDDDDLRDRKIGNGRSSALKAVAFSTNFGFRRHKDDSPSQASSPMLVAEPGPPAGVPDQIRGGLASPATSEDGDEIDQIISVDEDGDVLDPPDNSPYAQVRASVAATDDICASINTPRMWILSLLCALIGSASSLFFSLRYPSVAITPIIALVVVHPLGRTWDRLLKQPEDPIENFEYGDRIRVAKISDELRGSSNLLRLRLWLAQGRWNSKEHACVYISSNVSFGFAFATDVIVEQSKFYHQNPTILYQLLLTISTQVLGYAFAGLTRRYLVRPSSMIWPGTLMSTAMFTTMHSSENKPAGGWMITRWRFFLLVWSGAFAWYFLPGLLVPALSYFSVITWFAPNNVVVANLFGVSSGLGLFPMTFDWAQIAYIGSPLLTPWWAAANVVGGLVVVMWIIAPILYYKNALFSSFLPILSYSVFDNTGEPYDVSKILTKDYHFDHEGYAKYSKVYLPITYVLAYGVQFAGLAALITHTVCWHGKDIWRQSKMSLAEGARENKVEYQPLNSDARSAKSTSSTYSGRSIKEPDFATWMSGEDVHCRLMHRYEDAPISWYIATFVTMLAIGVFVVEYYPVYLPWYGLLLALSITAILFIPVGIVMAITNQHSSLYLVCQIICGFVFPGRPVANMVFVTYCYISSAQGIKFSSDLKLGHYMKIPPKLLFKVQIVATMVSSIVQIGVLNWMFAYIPNICTPKAINGFTCPIARVHFNGSILWGVVGPNRFFGPGALYRPLIWAFPIGFFAPILIWLIGRRSSASSAWRKVNLPVLFGSLSWIPPATGLNFSVWAVVCFLFNSHLRRRAPAWWGKYTMTLSAALDSGLAFGVLVVFFCFLYPGWGWLDSLQWWGTRVFKEGCDWKGCPYKTLAPGEHFG